MWSGWVLDTVPPIEGNRTGSRHLRRFFYNTLCRTFSLGEGFHADQWRIKSVILILIIEKDSMQSIVPSLT